MCVPPVFMCTARCTRADPNTTGTGTGWFMKHLQWSGDRPRASASLVQVVCAAVKHVQREVAVGDEPWRAFLDVLPGVWQIAPEVMWTVLPAWLYCDALSTVCCSAHRTAATA